MASACMQLCLDKNSQNNRTRIRNLEGKIPILNLAAALDQKSLRHSIFLNLYLIHILVSKRNAVKQPSMFTDLEILCILFDFFALCIQTYVLGNKVMIMITFDLYYVLFLFICFNGFCLKLYCVVLYHYNLYFWWYLHGMFFSSFYFVPSVMLSLLSN